MTSSRGTTAPTAARRSASIAGWMSNLRLVGIWLLALMHQFSAQVGPQTLSILDVVHRAGEEVPVDDEEVRQLALLEGAGLVFQKQEVGVVDGVEAESLCAAEGLLGMEAALVPPRPPRDRDPHRQE